MPHALKNFILQLTKLDTVHHSCFYKNHLVIHFFELVKEIFPELEFSDEWFEDCIASFFSH